MKRYLSLVLLSFFLASGCSWNPGNLAFGIGGHYNNARLEFIGRNGNFDEAISELYYVVSRDPLYKDSLTLLGRAYYRKKRYHDAFQVLKRALAVNPKDEIAWIALGLTQLKLGDEENGLKSIKGGITLLSRATKNGYRTADPLYWDARGLVRSALRRTILYAAKGLEEKRNLIRYSELLLYRIDNELWESEAQKQLDRETDSP